MAFTFHRSSRSLLVALSLGAAAAQVAPVPAAPAPAALATLQDFEPLPVLQRAADLGAAPADQPLVVAVSLAFADPAGMQAFADSVSDPHSPSYRQFLSPDEVGARFGQPLSRVQQVADHLVAQGFSLAELGRNRLAVVARGTVAQAEQAFHVTLRSYRAEPDDASRPREFIAPSTPVRLPAELAAFVIDVHGLDTYTRPRPYKTQLTPFLSRVCYDAQPIFDEGLTGAGRTIGMSNFDGFRSANWPLYISKFSLPVPPGGVASNISVVPVAGGGAGAGGAQGEGDLDIQMQLGAAPLANIRVYDSPPAGNLIAVLSAEASDNACDVISESWGWDLPKTTANSAHNQHLSMTAQGITYVAASGDFGTSLDPFGYPAYDPEVLMVGGTSANVNSTTGVRQSEVNWTGGGGGWSNKNVTFNVRPSWQTGTGVPPVDATNNKRLVPDVAFHSSGPNGAYQFYLNQGLTSAVGTSFAAPVFAGHLELVSLKTIDLGGLVPDGNGKRRFGRLQDLIYAQNNDPAIWFDIVSGASNGPLPNGGTSMPTPGWDTAVGWGPMDCSAFAAAVVCATGGCSGPWTNLGSGLAGTSGVPSLVGSGTLATGSSNSLALAAAKPSSFAVLFVSFSSTPTPFKGGTLLPVPWLTTVSLATSPAGAITLPFTWPAGPPSGFAVYFQYAVQDAAGPKGAALSNCERGLTP
jgi:subtilase family serine protease